jgi:hypothetical protein
VLGLPSSKGEVEGGVHSCALLTPGARYTPREPARGFVGGLEEAVAVALQTLPGIGGTAYSGFCVLGALA